MSIASDHGGNVFAVSRALGVAPEEILDFSASINPLGPPSGAWEAIAAAYGRIVHYPDSEADELREALAAYHGVAPANICVGNGSTELIYLIPRLIPGKRALIVAPPFSEYARALQREGWEVDYFPLRPEDGFSLPLAGLRAQLEAGYALLFMANPGNPTGRLYARDEVAELVNCCRAARTFLVLDEAFMDFCEEESAKGLVTAQASALVLRSMTKFFALPGLRLGYAVGTPAVIARLSELKEPWSVNTLAQAAGVASLSDAGYAAATRQLVAGERQWLADALAALPGLRVFPSAANYLLVEISQGPTAGELAGRLRSELILIRDCANFAGLDSRFFRVAVRGHGENERLVAALRHLLEKIA